jgi:peptide/nickel transport system substrate-binding protein
MKLNSLWYLVLIVFLLAGCSFGDQETPAGTVTTTEPTPIEIGITATPSTPPTPTVPPRRLTICISEEPETLYIYGGNSLAQRHILEAVYDGPVDTVGYQNQPVILEKLPSLADGDAVLEPVLVEAGDQVVNNAGQLVQLEPGDVVRPFGCASSGCAVAWDGGPLEMAQLSATFTLKEGIRWSDSTPLTAADSEFSYQIAADCQADFGACGGLGLVTRSGWEMLPRTASYAALDDRSVRWTGVPGYLDPAYQTNFFIPQPEHVLSQYNHQDLFTAQEAARQPLGWGPYVLSSWIPGEFISLRKNPNYFRAHEAEVKFDELLFRFIESDADRNLDLLTSGGCDLLDQGVGGAVLIDGVETLNQLEGEGRLQAQYVAGPVWEHADFGILPVTYDDGYIPGDDRPDFFRDVRVRQAFALCMDRQRIIDELLLSRSNVPASYLPQEHPLYNETVRQYGYDPAAGAQLLQEAGWIDHDLDLQTPRQALGIQGIVDGTPLQVTYTTSEATQRQAASQVLADSLAECGVQLVPEHGPASEVYAPGPEGPVFGRRFDLAQFAWAASNLPACNQWLSQQVPGDPIIEDDQGNKTFPFGWGGVNASGFRDSAYDLACELALGTLPGQPGYVENHHAAQSNFAENIPVVPLYQHLKLALSRPDFCGFSLDASAPSEFWNVENYDYGEGCQ